MAAPIVTPVTHVVFDVDGVLIGMILKYSATSLTMRDEVWFVDKIKWQLSTRKFNMLHFQFEASKLTAITEVNCLKNLMALRLSIFTKYVRK